MLTTKQEQFTLNLFKGMSQRQAYLAAGYSTDQLPSVIDVNASRLADNPKILLRLAELREQSAGPLVMSEIRRKEKLSEIADAASVPFTASEGIRAIAELNRMDGTYQTTPTIAIDNRQLHIHVPDQETADLLSSITDRIRGDDATQ